MVSIIVLVALCREIENLGFQISSESLSIRKLGQESMCPPSPGHPTNVWVARAEQTLRQQLGNLIQRSVFESSLEWTCTRAGIWTPATPGWRTVQKSNWHLGCWARHQRQMLYIFIQETKNLVWSCETSMRLVLLIITMHVTSVGIKTSLPSQCFQVILAPYTQAPVTSEWQWNVRAVGVFRARNWKAFPFCRKRYSSVASRMTKACPGWGSRHISWAANDRCNVLVTQECRQRPRSWLVPTGLTECKRKVQEGSADQIPPLAVLRILNFIIRVSKSHWILKQSVAGQL